MRLVSNDALENGVEDGELTNPNRVAVPGDARADEDEVFDVDDRFEYEDFEYDGGGVGMRDRVPCLETSRRPRSVVSSGVPGLAAAISVSVTREWAETRGSATNKSFSAKNEIFVPPAVFPLGFVECARGAATVLRYTVNSSKPTAPSPSLSAAMSCFLRNAQSSAVSNALTSPTSRSMFRNSTPLRLPSPSASYLSKTPRTSSREWLA